MARDPSTLVVATTEEPDSVDPRYANLAAANDVIALSYDGLVKFGPHGRLLPDLATEVPSRNNGGISADGKTIVYHLRRGVRWQDGAPFGSRDVTFTWHSIIDPHANVPAHSGYDRIASIDTPDAYTVRLRLKEPYAPVVSLFACARQGAIVPAHRTDGFIGTGPYRIVRWARGDEISFVRNPYALVRPAFSAVRLRFMPQEQTILAALQSGDADAGLLLSTPSLARAQTMAGVYVSSTASLEWEHLSFNLRAGSGPQSDVHVRRAIAYALAPTAIRAASFHDLGGLAPLDQAPDSWALDPSIAFYPRDLAASRRELRAAGYTAGRRVALTLLSTTANDERYRLEIALQSSLRSAGMDVTIKNVPANLLLARAADRGLLASGRFELALFSYVAISPDPNDERFVSSSAVPPSGVNMSAYRNPDVDGLVRAGVRTYDVSERARIYARIQSRLIADLPFYTLLWSPAAIVVRRELSGPQAIPVGSALWNVSAWRRTRTGR